MNAGPAIAKRSKPNVDPSTMAIGEIIYAANAIESLNGAIRESAKARGSFPTEEAAAKRIVPAIRNLPRCRWIGSVFDWIVFPLRVECVLESIGALSAAGTTGMGGRWSGFIVVAKRPARCWSARGLPGHGAAAERIGAMGEIDPWRANGLAQAAAELDLN